MSLATINSDVIKRSFHLPIVQLCTERVFGPGVQLNLSHLAQIEYQQHYTVLLLRKILSATPKPTQTSGPVIRFNENVSGFRIEIVRMGITIS